tara:strand:+ start:251 stop:502 length:252 start_codon:yes stop_codon:yes gene_type:complete
MNKRKLQLNEIEFIEEIATQLTELNFHDETFEMDIERDELGFTSESLEFYTERYKEIESLYNTLIKNQISHFSFDEEGNNIVV